MTTAMLPDFIFKLYHQQIADIVGSVIGVISDKYELDREEVKRYVERKCDLQLELVPDDVEKIRIIKSKPRKLPPDEQRCHAKIRTPEGLFVQCRCAKQENNQSQLCKRHINKPPKYGVIEDAANAQEKIGKRLTKIY